jgi:lipopolysaccharide biosynthesis protein
MSVLRKMVSLGYWLLDSEKSLSDFRKKAVWTEEDLIVETPTDKLMSPLVITAHVFYPEFATQLIDSLKQLPKETKVFVTTPSQEIKQDLESYLEAAGNPHDVRLTPNIGRNFGPLLVEFSKQLLKEESFIHVHSKKSLHSPEIAKIWLKINTDLLLTKEGLRRISSLTRANPRIGLAYADSSGLIRGINFRWGRSRRIAKKRFAHLPGFETVKWKGRLSFPAGGMFWVKTDSIRPLLNIDWSYDFFPNEENQRDGSLQHVIERLVGELSLVRGLTQAVLISENGKFFNTRQTDDEQIPIIKI